MAASISVHPDDRFALIHLSGTVTGQEFVETAAALFVRPDWERSYRVIWDMTEILELDIPVDAFDALLDQERRFRAEGEDGEVVFVIRDEVWASLVTLFQRKMREDARPMTVFATLAEARAHLRIETA